MIKKIEHFWKGLSNDRTQISALPPEQYGDRFYNFVEGITMSEEEAHREAQRRDEEMVAQQGASRRRSGHGIPPMPSHQPPDPPIGPLSPEARETVERATREALRTETKGISERDVPERIIKATSPSETRDSMQHDSILPIVEEDGETTRDEIEARPPTPPKDKALPPTRAPPPTPPKPGNLKQSSADSGYGNGITTSRDNSLTLRHRVSRESLNKSLPPLPKQETEYDGMRMAA